MLGPTGIGILYGKYHLLDQMEPFEYGGDMNEDVEKGDSTWKQAPQKFEAGTMPIASVIGLNKAIEYIENIGIENIHNHVEKLQRYAMARLKDIEGITIYNPTSETGIISFNLDNIPSHDAITFFKENSIKSRATLRKTNL
jgi:cysteine desulfurase/selenocysteine lyase